MADVTIRNLSEETHRALKVRAAQHNRSAEAETFLRPPCVPRVGCGSAPPFRR
ncbi:hypothetical protein M2232_004396 [Bradyrhizobium japonicum]|nr:hypothetical protein [Bradyrhizobium japonicum]MCS3931958.1 hypothetical protein [Bradyrhizobium elkanii]MCS3960256.1 hypothetical protein [Bradyrhizobium japonicum]MCS3972516.1 hypothetical protein [Bradyrhizobium japonicum]MCS3978653.1 hypothetical protein [Bradyrhizobium japonicum]